MDAGTRRRLILGMISNWVSRLASTIIQVVQVPFFLHFWSVSLFGEWMILNSVPNYLSFSNMGFGTVAGNEMQMAEVRGDREGALRAFQSCWWLIIFAVSVVGAIGALVLMFVRVNTIFALTAIPEHDSKWIIAYLAISILMAQVETLMQSAYRCVGRYSYGNFIKSSITLAAFAAMLVPVAMGYGARTTALVYAAGNVAGTILLGILVRRDIPWIEYGWKHARFSEIRRLAAPAIAFMGFPMGSALNLQGTLQAVGYALGPIAVVTFATARTMSRVAVQMIQMVNWSFEPEFTKSHAQNDHVLTRTLHRRACQMALLLAVSIVTMMTLGGPFLIRLWTHGKVPPSGALLPILLAVVIFSSLWSTSATILTSTNQHKRLAAVFLGATAITCVATFLMARTWGLVGAAASLLISEILMNLFVLPRTMRISHDTFPAFLRSLVDVPPSLYPRALLQRIRG